MNQTFFPFLPIIQDETGATFCKMLDKSDSLISLEMTNVQIWSHFRAFISFPFTILTDSYFGQIKILECFIDEKFTTLQDLEKDLENFENSLDLQINLESEKPNEQNSSKKITKIWQKDFWIQVKIDKKNLTFLICKDQTLLQITKICLSNGKKIDFSGYSFS